MTRKEFEKVIQLYNGKICTSIIIDEVTLWVHFYTNEPIILAITDSGEFSVSYERNDYKMFKVVTQCSVSCDSLSNTLEFSCLVENEPHIFTLKMRQTL